MRHTQLLCAVWLFMLISCDKRPSQTESTETANKKETALVRRDTLCFLEVTGRDTTSLRLVVNGSAVSGELAVLPFEKDRAQGSINGTQKGNQIIADWQRSGEGVMQSYEVIFTLKGDAITWREGERIEKEGKWVLKNPDQSYEYVLMKTACP